MARINTCVVCDGCGREYTIGPYRRWPAGMLALRWETPRVFMFSMSGGYYEGGPQHDDAELCADCARELARGWRGLLAARRAEVVAEAEEAADGK